MRRVFFSEYLREMNIPSLDDIIKAKAEETTVTNGPTKLTTDEQPDSEKPGTSETPNATAVKPPGTDQATGSWNETTSPPTNHSEGEEWYTPDPSNSEDSSLCFSDRTLKGEGDASEDDDYPRKHNNSYITGT